MHLWCTLLTTMYQGITSLLLHLTFTESAKNIKIKFIICTMTISAISGNYPKVNYMHDRCGCDTNLPMLIEEFVSL